MTTADVDPRVERRRWLGLVVLSVGQLMVALDSTVVSVALATIQRELHFSHSSLAWVVNSYLITYAGLLLLGGRLGDLLGRKRVFLCGLLAFTVASLLCGLSWSAPLLIAARFGQGVGGALMTSMVLGILGPMFPDSTQRTKALGIFAAVTLSGAALGLPVGGTLVQSLGWHWIFFINVPVGLGAPALELQAPRRPCGIGHPGRCGCLGGRLITGAPMLLVYALIETQQGMDLAIHDRPLRHGGSVDPAVRGRRSPGPNPHDSPRRFSLTPRSLTPISSGSASVLPVSAKGF